MKPFRCGRETICLSFLRWRHSTARSDPENFLSTALSAAGPVLTEPEGSCAMFRYPEVCGDDLRQFARSRTMSLNAALRVETLELVPNDLLGTRS